MMAVVQQVCHAINPRDRASLMQAIWDAFTAQIMDLWDMRRTHPGTPAALHSSTTHRSYGYTTGDGRTCTRVII